MPAMINDVTAGQGAQYTTTVQESSRYNRKKEEPKKDLREPSSIDASDASDFSRETLDAAVKPSLAPMKSTEDDFRNSLWESVRGKGSSFSSASDGDKAVKDGAAQPQSAAQPQMAGDEKNAEPFGKGGAADQTQQPQPQQQQQQQQMQQMQMQQMQMMQQMMQMQMQMMQQMMNMMQSFIGRNGGNNNNQVNNNLPTPPNNNNNGPTPPNNYPVNNNNQPTPPGAFRYGNNVGFMNFGPQKNVGNTGGGNFLNDIESHLPSRYGGQYRDRDQVTWSHETTHGINAHISNMNYDGGKRKTGLYVGDNRAVALENPNMRKSDVKGYIPDSLRGSRYNLYLNGQQSFENEPHYLLDEWAAYTNGLQTGLDLAKNGQGRPDNIVGLGTMGALEFTAYSFAEAQAIAEKDPNYWNSDKGKQFKEFMAWHGLRSMDLVRQGSGLERSKEQGQDRYLEELRTGASSQQLRDFISREFGSDYLRRLLG